MSVRRGAVVLVLALSAAVTSKAAADDEAAAETLFVRAREAMSKGDYARACPMLEESHRLVAGIGTKFNLAECYENIGLTATAWALYRDVAAASKLAGQVARENKARERAARLEPSLCSLAIEVASVPGLTVSRDGESIDSGQWGIAVPVDPGPHVIAASAPGRIAWSTTLVLERCPADERLLVPKLAVKPVEVPPPPAEPSRARASRGSGRTILTITSLGLGAAALGAGSYLGLRALSLRDEAADSGHCTGTVCDERGASLREESRTFGTGATVAFVSAGALLVLGAVLWLTEPPAPPAR